jgi:hypothetical protein
MLGDIAPSPARAGLLALKPGPLADRPSAREASHYVDVVRAAAEALKIELYPIEVSGPEEFESAFVTCDEKHIGGLVEQLRRNRDRHFGHRP